MLSATLAFVPHTVGVESNLMLCYCHCTAVVSISVYLMQMSQQGREGCRLEINEFLRISLVLLVVDEESFLVRFESVVVDFL